MGISFILLVVTLACALIAGGLVWRSLRRRSPVSLEQIFSGASTRKLTDEEYQAVVHYLETSHADQDAITPSGDSAPPSRLTLNPQSHTVVCLKGAITRYGFSRDERNKWRFYLDATEIHLPILWEQYITNDNDVELICMDGLPLVISLNGNTLLHYGQDNPSEKRARNTQQHAFIHVEQSEQLELLGVRKETPQEHALNNPRQLREAILICIAFFIVFLSLISPVMLLPWLLGCACVLIIAALWSIFSPPPQTQLSEIRCLRGTPKRWGLFGESNQEQVNAISLGIIDLAYPNHWQPYLNQELGHKTDIDLYRERQVIKQGAFLSLHNEVKRFPLQNWLRHLVIAGGSLAVLVMMFIWVPLDMPLKLTIAWISGAKTVQVSEIKELEAANLRVGDVLKIKGIGSCNIAAPMRYTARHPSPFAPFDCSEIVWNSAGPVPIPESDITQKAQDLNNTVKEQLHPATNDDSTRVNPQLATAIQRSGMVLLDDFTDIVQKTHALCTAENDCVRLKNALVNLGNSKDWKTLVRRAETGRLDGINVLLRPVSAESLNNLVIASTTPFFIRETTRAAQLLNSPAPGGYLFINDEDIDFVAQPVPQTALYDYPPEDQWDEFVRLAQMLLNTPFSVEAIVTDIHTDANKTQHVTLHSIEYMPNQWHYIYTCFILLSMFLCFVANSILAIVRYRKDQRRIPEIQRYYDRCLRPETPPLPSSGLHR